MVEKCHNSVLIRIPKLLTLLFLTVLPILGVTGAVAGFASGNVYCTVDLFLCLMGNVLGTIELAMTLFAMTEEEFWQRYRKIIQVIE